MGHTPLGTFEEHVLLAVLRLGESAYGMKVRRCLEDLTDRELAIGAVYSTLDRLESKGLAASSREIVDEKRRRTFRVTTAGADALRASRAMRARLWNGLELPQQPVS